MTISSSQVVQSPFCAKNQYFVINYRFGFDKARTPHIVTCSLEGDACAGSKRV